MPLLLLALLLKGKAPAFWSHVQELSCQASALNWFWLIKGLSNRRAGSFGNIAMHTLFFHCGCVYRQALPTMPYLVRGVLRACQAPRREAQALGGVKGGCPLHVVLQACHQCCCWPIFRKCLALVHPPSTARRYYKRYSSPKHSIAKNSLNY